MALVASKRHLKFYNSAIFTVLGNRESFPKIRDILSTQNIRHRFKIRKPYTNVSESEFLDKGKKSERHECASHRKK
jgi:hypothetical protein